MDYIAENVVDPLNKLLWNYALIYVLLGAGIYFTVKTRVVQFRLVKAMFAALRGSREGSASGGISSFQAFCVGLASRVGTGNIAGVAIALTLGGPGAIFWMWCLGLVGMATGFVEATLAQMYKVRWSDGSFRGGPAYYIQRGLGSRAGGVVFAVVLIFTFGIAFNMVQANTISDVLAGAHTVSEEWSAVILMVVAAPVLFGGVRRVARVAEYVLPAMALVYVVLALVILVMNLGELPGVISDIVRSAFGLDQALAGTGGGIAAALLNGAKRGLFSNEAGMGSAPNAAATATTDHPVKQGLIQSLGVFVDTLVICSATAFIILLSGDDVYSPGHENTVGGAALTQAAVTDQFGGWSTWLMTILVTVFAFSSVLGNYSYAEVNLDFLGFGRRAINVFRVVVLAAVGLGAVLALTFVWNFADVAMALMALINLTGILLLGRWAFGCLKDFEAARKAGRAPVFRSTDNPHLPGELPTEVWGETRSDASVRA
jgi:AGCS family alanine or glycine:cation symporter